MSSLFLLSPVAHARRPIPTRAQVCGVRNHFMGGLVVDSPVYGRMPWYDACLSWCDAQTRQNAYAVKKQAGDTHVIVEVPNGFPLYDEASQFYNADRFPALDWTHGETKLDSRFTDLLDEVIEAGFFPIIAMDERQAHSQTIVQLVMHAMTDEQEPYCLTVPGFDSVFYGWPPEEVTRWASLARAIRPRCHLGLEHNVGHIPLGEGGDDYHPGGRMDGFDVVLGEFGNPGLANDATWQVLGRMIRPYHRPPEQPANDDPNPPFYLVDSPRGPRFYCGYETWNPYNWVRVNPNDAAAVAAAQAQIEHERAYFRQLGCQWTG